ncbi:uncharacterized protein LOC135143224 [Zophobas morio]|uniref:uncharacterized protein LOC135143224 n=1 Tax=Zophobas morio TaxID=2755281 RepID=UPI003083151A
MISRGKNLVYLARSGKSNVPLNEVKLDESDEHSDEYNYDYLEDQYAEDPWSHFKKWQAAKKIKIPLAQRLNNSYCNQKDNHMENDNQNFEERVLEELRPLETSPQLSTLDHNLQGNVQTGSENSVNSVLNDIQNHEDPVNQLTPLTTTEAVHTCNDQLLNSAEKEDHNSDDENSHLSESSLFADSSVSWKPNQENDVTSEDNYSEISESIPRKSPIYFQTASKERQSSNPVKCIESSLDAKNPLPTSPKPLPTSDCDLSGSTRRPIHKNPVEHSLRKGRVWDKKDRCSYCDKDVTNFSRHLFRKHAEEESVRKILEQPKGERKRKIMIDLIRKQGNFTVLGENITRPVQRPSAIQSKNDEILPTDYLPCIYCKGLYKKKSLRRHALTCCYNKEINQKHNFASEGQTMIAFTESRQEFLKKSRLKCEVFSKMRADRISLNGKSDPIICQYAEDYLRKHKRPHIKNAVSNKVRELGRLLIPLQDIYKINSMLEVLKPEHFDKVVSASRIISGYNEAKRSFKAPSLALHMKTILLAVCSSAKTLMLKKHPILGITDYDIALKNVKGFRELVDANWKFEMSSLALKDLNEKQSINPQKLPVTQDIILFRNYTQEIAETCVKELETNSENLTSFKKLTEAALALTIILNRKRIGNVQYTQL